MALALVAATYASPLRAQPGEAPVAADSAAVDTTGLDREVAQRPARNARGERLRPWHQAPWAIMARSGIAPGWGQWTNGRPWKALLVTGAEVTAGIRLVDAMRDTDAALERERAALAAGDEAAADRARAEYLAAFDRRATWAWIAGAAVALAMLDAYVDAHLLQFDADFGPDPKLFDDGEPAGGRSSGGAPDLRVGLRLTFQGPPGR